MPSYQAPVDEVLFLFNDVFNWSSYAELPGFADAPMDVVEAILTEAAKLAEDQFQPVNMIGDREGCVRNADGSVTTPKGFKAAYDAFKAGEWLSLPASPTYGGQGLPATLAAMVNEFIQSANMALSMYPGLTQSAVAAINVHANDDLKAIYLPKMISAEWSGTMNLTEPHCGTDLGLLKTKAVRKADGSFAITGQKIFISAGEHDLTSNIIHLVLARIEGAPSGTKGISLFIVPKFIPDAAGNPGLRNGVTLGSIEHKMGIHGNATCVMNYDGATGWLIGEENRGLNAMFVMMNEARLGVALQGLSQSVVAYQNAAIYARERLQGRSLSGVKAPDKVADPIIVHPDIRRLLMTMRAYNEAGRAFIVWAYLKSDVVHRSSDKACVQAADDLLGLMTPVLKGVLTDIGFQSAVDAQQVFGGHGYVGEWGMEQFVRDARIAMIYEGANGIQALDLVGRKLPKDGGRAIMAFFKEVGTFLKTHAETKELASLLPPLNEGLQCLQKATGWFMQNAMAKPDNAGSGSYDYMNLLGHVTMGYMWALMVQAAEARFAEGRCEADWVAAKRTTAAFYMQKIMPQTKLYLARIEAGSETLMAMDADAF